MHFYNTLTRQLEPFVPLDPANIRMYVCGPTVYDYPHIGNARAVVVYDVLFRILRGVYGENAVTYVRNITDVDDKIIAAAKTNGEPIAALTERITRIFHENMAALGCLLPTHEPKATEHIGEMVAMIEKLLVSNHAYITRDRHVYFDVTSDPGYGRLAGRTLEEMQAGARVIVAGDKRHPGDFVLWKPADSDDGSFDSPWGRGRPGWHIECSAMSSRYLGNDFDIHGGGADLMFPHHTNEIAQSCCANPGSHFAKLWIHNGFLTVNGEKMSKSLGNFITVQELLDKGIKGEVIRYLLLSTHYRKPLDFNDKALSDAEKAMDSFYRALEQVGDFTKDGNIAGGLQDVLGLDIGVDSMILAFSPLHELAKSIHKETDPAVCAEYAARLYATGRFLGFFAMTPKEWFSAGAKAGASIDEAVITAQIEARREAKKAKDWVEADRIRKELAEQGIILEDKPDGTTLWRR